MMYALTVRQPWAWAIIHAGKYVENRSWSTAYRGPLAIHAGKSYDYEGGRTLERRGFDLLVDMPGGAIIGVVDVVACIHVTARQNQWLHRPWGDPDCWHWLLKNPRPLSTPIPCRGFQGLWQAPVEAERFVRLGR